MIRRLGWQAFVGFRSLGPFLAGLQQHQLLPGPEARLEMGARLLRQLQYFARRDDALPAWRDVARVRSVDELWEAWPSLPCVTKADLQTRFRAEELQAREQVTGQISATGGSTGEPTTYLHDRAMLRCTAACRYFARRELGWHPGLPTIGVWGSERDIGKQQSPRNRLSGWLRNDWLVAGYRLDQTTVDEVVAQLTQRSPCALFGFTSMLEFLARSVLERDLAVRGFVHAAWNGGEMLYDEQARIFHEAFGVPLRNFYGGRELGPMGYQPHGESFLRVLRPWLFAEIVDDQNQPVGPGESGRLLWTSTVCRGTPFLRYEIGDLATSEPTQVDVSGVRAIGALQGRTSGLLTLPTGRTINCIFWNHLFKEIPEIRQFQVVLRGNRELRLRLQGNRWDSARDQQVRDLLRTLLGDIPVGVDWVTQIPATAQGKRLQVVHEP